MSIHAYVVLIHNPGASELWVAVAENKEDARDIIAHRSGARTGEDVSVLATLSNEAARKIGADLSRPGVYANFVPGGSNSGYYPRFQMQNKHRNGFNSTIILQLSVSDASGKRQLSPAGGLELT